MFSGNLSARRSDPYFANVSIYINGQNKPSPFIDLSPNALPVTQNGGISLTNAYTYLGQSSIDITNTNAFLTAPNNAVFNLTSGDFTLEAIVRLGGSGTRAILSYGENSISRYENLSYGILVSSANKIILECSNGGVSEFVVLIGSTTLLNNTFYHVAATRQGSTFRVFVNGNVDATQEKSGTFFLPVSPFLKIGRYSTTGSTNTFPLQSYVQYIRITKGVARYSSNFTPPNYPYPFR